MGEHPLPHVAQEALADPADEQHLRAVAEEHDDGDDDVRDDGGVQERGVLVGDAVVDGQLDQVRPGQGAQRVDDEQDQARSGSPDGRDRASCRGRRRTWRACRASSLSSSSTALIGIIRRLRPSPAQVAGLLLRGGGRRQHLAVALARLQQGLVGAVGGDPAAVDQHHPVGEGDGGRPVGDDERRAAAHDLGQGVADLVLLGGVDRGRGVVEDQDPGVGEDGPGDGDALALSARQRVAPLADLGVRSRGAAR